MCHLCQRIISNVSDLPHFCYFNYFYQNILQNWRKLITKVKFLYWNLYLWFTTQIISFLVIIIMISTDVEEFIIFFYIDFQVSASHRIPKLYKKWEKTYQYYFFCVNKTVFVIVSLYVNIYLSYIIILRGSLKNCLQFEWFTENSICG